MSKVQNPKSKVQGPKSRPGYTKIANFAIRLMKKLWFSISCFGFFGSLMLAPSAAYAAPDPQRGLWVGEVTLTNVNQVGTDAYLQAGVTPPGPGDTTPTASAAHLRLIVHVDASGQARLLKSVTVFGKTNTSASPNLLTNLPTVTDLSLVTDPALYPNYTGVGTRVSAVAFDFGDLAVYYAITNVAGAVAKAASTAALAQGYTLATVSAAAEAARATTVAGATTNALLPVSANYYAFVGSANFTTPAANAAAAAASAAFQAASVGGALPQAIANRASSAALLAMTSAFKDGDALNRNDAEMTGHLTPGLTSAVTFFLGASHPTNPFRHRMHPDHSQGYDVIRTVQLLTDSTPTGGASQTGGFGVDWLSGIYQEEIHGLHKPLGPSGDIGLKTAGRFTLRRASLVDALNQPQP